MLLAEGTNGLAYLVFGFAIVTTLLAFRSVRRMSQSSTARQSRPTPNQPVIDSDAFRRQEVELHEIGREIQARIDNKLSLLEMQIQQARRESERLERLLDEAKQFGGTRH